MSIKGEVYDVGVLGKHDVESEAYVPERTREEKLDEIETSIISVANHYGVRNFSSSEDHDKHFETVVLRCFERNCVDVEHRPNGRQRNPAISANGIDIIIKSNKNTSSPMMNETCPDRDSLVFFCGKNDRVAVVTGDKLVDERSLGVIEKQLDLIKAMNEKIKIMGDGIKFSIKNIRHQFKDSYDWKNHVNDYEDIMNTLGKVINE